MKKIILLLIILLCTAGCSNEPTSFDELSEAGKKAFVDGDYATARKYLKEALQQNQSDRDVLYFLGVSYERDFLYDSALIFLKRADLLHKNDPEINRNIYAVAQQLDEYKYALDALNSLIRTGDSEDRYIAQLADLNYAVGYYIPAYVYYSKMLAKDSTNKNLYFKVANIASQIDSVHIALRVMELAIARFGDMEQFETNRAIYLAGLERYDEAEAILRRYLNTTNNPQALKINLASVLSKQPSKKKKREGLKLYKELQQEIPSMLLLDSMITELEAELKQ